MGTPCTTFSRARQGPPGPVPLRTYDQLYGRPASELSQADVEALRQGNYFALKSADMAWSCLRAGVGFGLENPEPFPGAPSLFLFREFLELQAASGVNVVNFDQCTLGAETPKPTRILFYGIDLSHLSINRCRHEHQEWVFKNWAGKVQTKWGPHPPLFGRRRDSGEPATKASSAYPYDLNKAIVQAIIKTRPSAKPPALPTQS
jgi:hypothetical protein